MARLAPTKDLARLMTLGIHAAPWYERANESIRLWASDRGLPTGLVCDVLALVSPRKTVADSVRIGKHWLLTGKLIDVFGAVRKQFAHWQDTGYINGSKCRAFASALMCDRQALVVDTWIMKALNAPINSTGTQWVLNGALRRFSKLSEVSGLPIAHCQAAVWAGVQGGNCAFLEMGGN